MSATRDDISSYEVYVTSLRPNPILFGENGTHWAIMIAHPGMEYGTMYHIIRCRRQAKLDTYERHVRSFKPLDGDEVIKKRRIATIQSTDIDRFNTILASVPLRDSQIWDLEHRNTDPYQFNSEKWTLEVVVGLEDWQMVPYGTSIFLDMNSFHVGDFR
ncbi:hypothetical protein N7532_000323 [Penicillium argentinense]|uniref:Uncharacterized protein n=1 Tax=Penicillium argentinense TaxID=1131581 RepID=A0A9W9G5F5_9EURO|nr:uncharacterized protein N7532_000323 [Penicillium argentinense]KAJ5112278.1 hypothetical protein N7532_000323 [Penicillium argentinense]